MSDLPPPDLGALRAAVAALAPRADALAAQWREREPAREVLQAVARAVAQFIRDRRLVVYGGQAIDLALRQAGHAGIYDDAALPDWDFYSADHAADAYALAELLAVQFAPRRFRVHRAKHLQTVRVRSDELSRDTVADISFLPPAMFARVPVLERDGLRFVHPHWQFADQHLSLSQPYGRFPGENIFFRWGKEVARHRLLHQHFPPPAPAAAGALTEAGVPAAVLSRGVLGGLTAAAACAAAFPDLEWPPLLAAMARTFRADRAGARCGLPAWHCEAGRGPHADVIVDGFSAADAAALQLPAASVRAAMDMAWPAVVAGGPAPFRAANSAGALVPFATLQPPGQLAVRCAGPQVLLKQLAYWASARAEPRYWAVYSAIRRHCTAFQDAGAAGGADAPAYWRLDALLDAAHTYGAAPADPADEFRERDLRARAEGRADGALATVPAPYAPAVVDGRVTTTPPAFAPAPPWFALDGQLEEK